MRRILKVLQGGRLVCGCTYGVYECYDGTIVALIDGAGAFCHERHEPGQKVPAAVSPHVPPTTPRRPTA